MKHSIILVYALLLLITGTAISSCNKDQLPGNNPVLNDTVIKNVSYGSDEFQKYDIYLPAHRDTSTPVILMLHGGAWKAGQKEDFDPYIHSIQSKWNDVAIVNMNYRLASNARNIHHNEIMSDIRDAIGHVLSHKTDYVISSKMGVVGASAGAQLAMIYAYAYNDYHNISVVADLFGPCIINDWDWYNSYNLILGANIGDILTEYVGQPWDSAVYRSVSPYWQATSSSQPVIIFHGTLDPIVPLYQSQWFNIRLNSLGVTHEYYEYVAFHGFDATQTEDVMNKLINFFKPKLE